MGETVSKETVPNLLIFLQEPKFPYFSSGAVCRKELASYLFLEGNREMNVTAEAMSEALWS
jgi:hypothetical protein